MASPLIGRSSRNARATPKLYFPLFSVGTYRVIRELEAQLEYEREKREKLEAQMDKLRAQIHTLTLQLEDERGRHLTAVGNTFPLAFLYRPLLFSLELIYTYGIAINDSMTWRMFTLGDY